MILIPDDEPELSLPQPVRNSCRRCQVRMPRSARPGRHLLSLNSHRSRQTMASFLNIVAVMLGAASLESCSWGSLRRIT